MQTRTAVALTALLAAGPTLALKNSSPLTSAGDANNQTVAQSGMLNTSNVSQAGDENASTTAQIGA